MALKIGTEEKKKVIIAAGLGVVVLGLVLYNLFGGPGTPSTPAPAAPVASAPPPVVRQSTPPVVRERAYAGTQMHEAVKVPGSMAALDPTLHPELMAQAESLEYTGKGRNIFSMSSAPATIEQVKGPIRPQPVMPIAPSGPPPPPPIELKFFGFEAHQGGGRRAFFLHGDDVFIAAEGDVVDHRYKVVKIGPLSAQVEDLPYNNTQTLPLVQN